jgi:hypothetical protein
MDDEQLKDFFRAGVTPAFICATRDGVLANFVAAPGAGQCVGTLNLGFCENF